MIEKGDLFQLENPHPLSDLKNVVMRASIINEDSTITPETKDLVLRKYPKMWCKKITLCKDEKIKIGDYFIWNTPEGFRLGVQKAIPMDEYVGINEIPIGLIGNDGVKIIFE